MTINAPAAVLMAMYMAVAEKQGVPFTKIGDHPERYFEGEVAREPISFPRESMRLIVDIFAYAGKIFPPGIRSVSAVIISGKPVQLLFKS